MSGDVVNLRQVRKQKARALNEKAKNAHDQGRIERPEETKG